ncbi:MAG: hypothetical protein GX575_23655 [Candidatus Anammoximicrobium sp.]|nr:hypothetical protein [Candidatus Anammoximicrobium sp.]
MSSRSILSVVGALGIVVTLASVAAAQHYQPFIEPGYFNHDLQFFAPASDIDTYDGDVVLRTGWFGSYNRMYIGLSRPEDANYPSVVDAPRYDVLVTNPQGSDLLDMTWGNRWDLGYIVDDVDHDHGWLVSYMNIGGPNVGQHLIQEKLNRVNEDDEGFVVQETDDEGGGGGDENLEDTINPPSDRNDEGPPNRWRFYDVTNSLNFASLNSVELNKLFRLDPLHDGGILEPFLGVRYMKFEDRFQRQGIQVYDEDGFSPLMPPFPPSSVPMEFLDVTTEDFISDQFRFTNQMITGQLGMRWLRRVSRWNLTAEFRAFGGQNYQHLSRTYQVDRTYYDGQGTGSEVDAHVKYKQTQGWNTNETVVGTDIRAVAAYEITRDIKLECGVQFLGLFTGIGRGPYIDANSEAVTAVGTTFGFTVNR